MWQWKTYFTHFGSIYTKKLFRNISDVLFCSIQEVIYKAYGSKWHIAIYSHIDLNLTHLCLFSATLNRSHTSLDWGESTSCTPQSSKTARARSGPAVRASMRVRFSGLILPPQSAEPLDQLLPFTPVVCSEAASLLHCWDSWIRSFHSSKFCGSTPGK